MLNCHTALRFDGKLESDTTASGFRIEDRRTAFTVAACRQHEITPRVTLGYLLGGYLAARQRDVYLTEASPPPAQTRRVEDVLDITLGPALGVDAGIALTTKLRFVPSARAQLPVGGGEVAALGVLTENLEIRQPNPGSRDLQV